MKETAVVKNQGTKQRVQRILGDCWLWESNGQCIKGEQLQFPPRIRLQILSCSRLREKHREREVPEEDVPVVECLDGFARITLKELAITHFVKSGTLQNACTTRPRVVAGQVDEQPTKRSKKNDVKSTVAMLKKGDWHEHVWEPVVNYGHYRSLQPGKKRDHELERGSTGRRSSNARQLGCPYQDTKPPKSILWKSTNMQ